MPNVICAFLDGGSYEDAVSQTVVHDLKVTELKRLTSAPGQPRREVVIADSEDSIEAARDKAMTMSRGGYQSVKRRRER